MCETGTMDEPTSPATKPEATPTASLPTVLLSSAREVVVPPTPGWRTSEFWLKVAAITLSALFASGALTNNTALAIAGMAATILGALGYTVSRTLVKTAGVIVLVGLLASPQLACSAARGRGASAAGAFLDCEAPNVVAVLPDAIALARQAIMRWISGGGQVDPSGLKSAAGPLQSDLGKCAFDAAIAALSAPPQPAATGAPASSSLEIDRVALTAAWSRARAELCWAPAS